MSKPIPSELIPLSAKQKSVLAQAAKAAYRRQKKLELTNEPEDTWRAREALECPFLPEGCPPRRISKGQNRHYNPLAAHFYKLAGMEAQAFDHLMRMEGDPHRQAMVKLDEELLKHGRNRAYAEEICKDVCKCTLAKADPVQVWQIMFTIRMRGEAPECPPDCGHTSEQHEAFDAGLAAGARGAEDAANPYRGAAPAVRDAWMYGRSAGNPR